MPDDRTMRAHALAHGAQGRRVFPLWGIDPNTGHCSCEDGANCKRAVKQPGKHPVLKGGHNSGTADAAGINELWNKAEWRRGKVWAEAGRSGTPPELGIGWTSDGLVIDVDGRKGFDVLTKLKAGQSFPQTLSVGTGREGGGVHLIYNVTDENLRNQLTISSGDKHPGEEGLDVRAGGKGYTAAAPTLHKSGKRYREINSAPIAEAPAWLVDWAIKRSRLVTKQRKQQAIAQTTAVNGEAVNFPCDDYNIGLMEYRLRFIAADSTKVWENTSLALGALVKYCGWPEEVARGLHSGWSSDVSNYDNPKNIEKYTTDQAIAENEARWCNMRDIVHTPELLHKLNRLAQQSATATGIASIEDEFAELRGEALKPERKEWAKRIIKGLNSDDKKVKAATISEVCTKNESIQHLACLYEGSAEARELYRQIEEQIPRGKIASLRKALKEPIALCRKQKQEVVRASAPKFARAPRQAPTGKKLADLPLEAPAWVDWPITQENDSAKPVAANLQNANALFETIGLTFKYDTFREEEICEFEDGSRLTVNDNIVNSLDVIAHKAGLPCPHGFIDRAIRGHAAGVKINSAKEWLDALPEWDSVSRMDVLIKQYGADDCEYSRAVFTLFVVAIVRRILKPGYKYDHIMILQGSQGQAKSWLGRGLVGEEFFTDDIALNMSPKELLEKTLGIIVGEMAEMRKSKHDVAVTKHNVSKQADKARLAYGKRATKHLRMFTLYGTTNDDKPLADQTGNRRFYVVQTKERADVKWLCENGPQIMAEAKVLEKDYGKILELPAHLAGVAEARQMQAVERDVHYETIADLIADIPCGIIPRSEVQRAIGVMDTKELARDPRIGKAIRQAFIDAGWEEKRVNTEQQAKARCYVKVGEEGWGPEYRYHGKDGFVQSDELAARPRASLQQKRMQ